VEGSSCGLSCQYGSNHEVLVSIIGILVEIWTGYFPNTSDALPFEPTYSVFSCSHHCWHQWAMRWTANLCKRNLQKGCQCNIHSCIDLERNLVPWIERTVFQAESLNYLVNISMWCVFIHQPICQKLRLPTLAGCGMAGWPRMQFTTW
jgi:hypothetical protein